MKRIDTALPEVKRVTLDMHGDARGFFVERFHRDKLAALGIAIDITQINHSHSAPGVLRGLHFQHAPAQGKLVGVVAGTVLDVAVDIRPHSPRFGQHVAVELSADNGELLWIPAGFAHGFCVLGDAPADLLYCVDAPYDAHGEAGITFNDAALSIRWPTTRPTLSPRDAALPSLADLTPQLKQWFPA